MDLELDPAQIISRQCGIPSTEVESMDRQQLRELRDQTAARYQDFLDAVDTLAAYGDDEGEHLPIMLGGPGPYCCTRCGSPFVAVAWRVAPMVDQRVRDICPPCADADPDLRIWSQYCALTGQIDDLMQATPDAATRKKLAVLLAGCAEHFSAWRWPNEDGDQADGETS